MGLWKMEVPVGVLVERMGRIVDEGMLTGVGVLICGKSFVTKRDSLRSQPYLGNNDSDTVLLVPSVQSLCDVR